MTDTYRFKRPTAYSQLEHLVKTEGELTLTTKQIGKKLGYTDRSISYAITKLVESGLVEISYKRIFDRDFARIERTLIWVGDNNAQ